jgi:hypothetical protein
MIIIGTIIISILCIYNYSVNKRASDALLNFVIAILTLFTISTDTTKTIIFIVAYFIVTITIFLISSVNLYLSVEKILMRAALELYGNDDKLKEHIKELVTIEKRSKSVALKSIEKSEIILFFSQRKMPAENNSIYIPTIEDFKVGTGLDLNQSCESIYFLFKVVEVPINSELDIAKLISLILDNGRSLPLSSKIFYELILNLQDVFLVGNISAINILNEIKDLIITGHTTDYIIKKMHHLSSLS